MLDYFTPDSIDQLRYAIRDANDNEIFVLAQTDADKRIVQIEVLARGGETSVTAILQTCGYGDVVIHNHPSGDLRPSGADIEVASQFGSLGVGFYIVNNAVDNLYRVVEAFAAKDEQKISPEQIGELLGPEGVIAENLPDFEERPEQLRMAFTVAEAFNSGKLAVVEAGTGTGKSLAYLVPALLWARSNNERVVISTRTINLQEQLIRKDLPFLERATKIEFRAVLVKGRSNYLCWRRSETAGRDLGLFDQEQVDEIQQILKWAETTSDGSKEDLSFIPSYQAWEEVCCEADQCARVRCQHYSRCFFHKARRQAARADVLVVNHALLLSDLSLRLQTSNYSATAVLPPFERVVLDEAHHLEDVATSYFSSQITRFTFSRVLNRLRHPRKPNQGLLPRFLDQLSQKLPESEDELYRALHGQIETLISKRQQLLETALEELQSVGEELPAALGKQVSSKFELKHRVLPDFLQTPVWQQIYQRVEKLRTGAHEMADGILGLLKSSDALPEEVGDKLNSSLVDLRGIAGRLEGLAADLASFQAAADNACIWLEVREGRIGRGKGLITSLCQAPLEVADSLNKALYERFRTLVMTSATLTVAGAFGYFHSRVGLDRVEPGRLLELTLDSPFDYQQQALVAIPKDLPEPGKPGFAEAVRDAVEKAVLASGGRSFVLFTSYALLRQVHEELSPVLEAQRLRCLRQGSENRHRLLKRFAEDESSILFGTDSFWEGVDVPGRSLEQVIIARLPFKVPTEPVLEARAQAIEARGGDSFMEYTVPQAVIRFKQGFGRLIRHRKDRGVVLILDTRVVRRGYGRMFLRSLPPARVVNGDSEQVFTEIRNFFSI
ncbi:ATP-dependent DNA helicase DinG [Malonomonas rubra DSM 5091]|uniref:DNA 5'-3' helicase n=1 Tax=Malonomonas rubra DSM 5091 TaxID=1122189 RepID=A0A1M6HDC7_MALRU|nr:helicase C-terminal domain-containing protein [Malonomonas rubra]SHJ20205.1 ATP-dependent DNA helicase DinG [Malonomonas rubra DSM 5091]